MEITMTDATPAAAETSGDSTTTAAATEATTTEAPAVANGEAALGDAGKKALDTMKAERNAERDARKALEADFAALKAKVEGKEAAANDRILKAEVRAAAASKLNDPQDALRFLDLSGFEVGSDGEVDASQVAKAIDDLITSKPYLAAQGGKRFQGTADGGARNDAAQPKTQLSKADLASMTPAEINQARRDGRLTDLNFR